MSNADTLTHRDVIEVTATTVRIPHDLLIEAKSACVTEKTSVNELLISGLRRELDARKAAKPVTNGNEAAGQARQAARPTAKQS